ncbi:MAG TPA: CAP domain-containing protein [Solirubrobacteraceae bacterium]
MSPRHLHPHLHRILLIALLLCGLSVSAYAAPVGTPTRAVGHHATHHVCSAHAKRHHARGCKSKAHHRNSHQRAATHRQRSSAHQRTAAHRHSATPNRHSATPRRTPVQPSEAARNAATIAAVLATPCQNTQLTPDEDNLPTVTAATLCLVNQERARHNELPLQQNADLETAADAHSTEMVALDYFAHVAPNGLTPLARVRGTGYIPSAQDGYTIGENIAWGTLELSTPQAIVAAWIASPEHLVNILEANYRDTAIGIDPEAPASLANEEDGAVYTQEFGVIIG